MGRQRLIAGTTPAAILLVAMLTAACADGSAGDCSPSGTPAMAVGRSDLLPTDPTVIPDFDLVTFRELMTDLRGTPVLVYAWASWCGPCYREADQVAAIASALDGRVQPLGLNIQDHPTPACEFVQQFGWTFPSVADPRKEVLRGLGFIAPPVTVLYDAEGVELSVWSGPINSSTVLAEIEKALPR